MKKSIFIIAALFAAMFAKAQITLEHTFDGKYYCKSTIKVTSVDEKIEENIDFPFFYTNQKSETGSQITLVNPFDYSIYKTINLDYAQIVGYPCGEDSWYTAEYFAFTYNVLVPNKVAFIIAISSYVSNPGSIGFYPLHGLYVVDEDGIVHKSFLYEDGYTSTDNLMLTKIRNEYKLMAYKYEKKHEEYGDIWDLCCTEIYALPGSGGDYAGTTNPSAPKRNARKYINNDQVLVETENNTYTLQGQEVK